MVGMPIHFISWRSRLHRRTSHASYQHRGMSCMMARIAAKHPLRGTAKLRRTDQVSKAETICQWLRRCDDHSGKQMPDIDWLAADERWNVRASLTILKPMASDLFNGICSGIEYSGPCTYLLDCSRPRERYLSWLFTAFSTFLQLPYSTRFCMTKYDLVQRPSWLCTGKSWCKYSTSCNNINYGVLCNTGNTRCHTDNNRTWIPRGKYFLPTQ